MSESLILCCDLPGPLRDHTNQDGYAPVMLIVGELELRWFDFITMSAPRASVLPWST